MQGQNISYWNQTVNPLWAAPLSKSIEAEVVILGGGISGITCAYCLARQGLHPIVLEAGQLGDGTTGNTTGKITIQHNIIYSNLIKKYGIEAAKEYARSQTGALDFVRQQVSALSIDCQLTENTAYAYAQTPEAFDSVQQEYEAAVLLGIEAELIRRPDFPSPNFGMVGFKHQLVFHPMRYLQALSHAAVSLGARIYGDTKAIHLEDGEPVTVFFEHDIAVRAKHVVMATQYPFYDGPNLFYARLYAKRAYGVAVLPQRDWPLGSYISVDAPARSIRSHMEHGQRILIMVGEGHATGREEPSDRPPYEVLTEFADQVAGVEQVLARWSAQDYETPDQIPYIGRLSDHSHIYVASGFGKWGLSSGTLAGNLIAQLITTGNCDYEGLYSRTRGDLLHAPGKVVREVVLPVWELIRSKLESPESLEGLRQGEGRVIRYDGRKAGIFRDADDNVVILDINCTHMGTTLNFNPSEQTWDCPAHGGRYNVRGELLEGPPKHDLKVLFEGRFSDLMEDR